MADIVKEPEVKVPEIAAGIKRVGISTVLETPKKGVPTPGAESPVMKTLSEVSGLPENDPRRQEAIKRVEEAIKKHEEKPYSQIPLKKPFTTKTTSE